MEFDLIDLTHKLTAQSPSWNLSCGYHADIKLDYDPSKPISFRVQQIKMHAGIGTHMDAPAHCIEGGKTIADIALNQLLAPCYVLDVSDKAHERYSVTLEDIQAFEERYEPIRDNSVLIVYTGWDQFWQDPKKYHNNYLFPNISKPAIEFLMQHRKLVGIGIDTLSPDRPEEGFPVHQLMLGAGKYIIENVAHAKKLAPVGDHILALPLNLETTEAPMRLVGLRTKNRNT